MPLAPIAMSHAIGGQLVRFAHTAVPVPVLTAPGEPSGVTTSSLTSSSVTLSWGAPASTGGSPVTGYAVSRDGSGATTVSVDASTRAYQFLNLTASTTYNLSVAAVNAVGTGAARTVTVTTGSAPGPVTGARFAGDPQPKLTRRLYWGGENKTNDVSSLERSGVKLGAHRTYFAAGSNLTPPGAPIFVQTRADHAAGRLPIPTFRFDPAEWAAIGGGSRDALFDSMIAEWQSYAKPTWPTLIHEPENDGGNAADWRAVQSRFRARLNAWVAAHPGSPNRIAFGNCLMDWTFDPKSGRNPEDWFVPGVFDWLGVDPYAWSVNTTLDATYVPWKNFVAFTQAKGLPYVVCEWGYRHDDPNKAQKIQAFYDLNRDGAHDALALCYFNVSNGGVYDWPIEDTDAVQLSAVLSTWDSVMADPHSIHLSDLGY